MRKLFIKCGILSSVLVLTICTVLFAACSSQNTNKDKFQYIDVFAGASDIGHTSPSAGYPLSMTMVSPQSGNESWYYCSGYQYNDDTLYGFTQTRLNGTGRTDFGDLLMFPYCGDNKLSEVAEANNASTYQEKSAPFKSLYKNENQHGEPGYYRVYLDDAKVNAELAAMPHTSIQKYTYDDGQNAKLMIDFQSGITRKEGVIEERVLESEQNFVDDTHIAGHARTKVWLERDYYYEIEFSHPIKDKVKLDLRDPREKAPRYVLSFDIPEGESLSVKVSVSKESVENASNNIKSELPGWDFDGVKNSAQNEWAKLLNTIDIEGTDLQKEKFYSAMYRLFLHPDNVADVGQQINYSTLSLWDTFRSTHPLYSIIKPDLNNDVVNSLLDQFDEIGHLPVWSIWGEEGECMIANHAVPVIVDSYLKGIRNFDVERAYNAIKVSLTSDHYKTHWEDYDKYGYIPLDHLNKESVSITLESTFDDYCASLMAKDLGKMDDYEFFSNRANYWKNLFDQQTLLMRGKDSNGNWREPFDGFWYEHYGNGDGSDYTEGNAWHYTWHVLQDIPGLIDMFGGKEKFCSQLDILFRTNLTKERGFEHSRDITGLIGEYAHGNEPCHHVAYLYRLAGQPHKTEALVNEICNSLYKTGVEGLCGNEDCGAMSAWYIFSVLGFYPVNPCGGEFVYGAPQVESATIHLPNGKTFTVKAENFSEQNYYVDKIYLNGEEVSADSITYQDIMNGGELTFHMTYSKDMDVKPYILAGGVNEGINSRSTAGL